MWVLIIPLQVFTCTTSQAVCAEVMLLTLARKAVSNIFQVNWMSGLDIWKL